MPRIQRVLAQYPYLCLFVAGFCVMIAPLMLLISLLGFGQLLADEWQTPAWFDRVLLMLLRASVSTPVKAIGWTIFALGSVVMNVGLVLHVRHRRKQPHGPLVNASTSPEQHPSQVEVAEQRLAIAESERDQP